MPSVPVLITDLSTTAASNAHAGTDSPSVLDDVQRAQAAFIAQIRDGTVAVKVGAVSPTTGAFTTLSATGLITYNGTNTQVIVGELDSGTTFIQSKNSGGTAKALAFLGSAEYGRFDTSGTLSIGSTSTTPYQNANCIVNRASTGSGYYDHANLTASGTDYVGFGYNGGAIGSITQSGTTAVLYNTTSDYRLKNVVGPVSGSGARIDALQPIEYTWKSDGSITRGFLAHEFQEVYAKSVNGTKDAVDAEGNPVYQSMQAGSSEVIADLVAEIQSLRARLTALEAA